MLHMLSQRECDRVSSAFRPKTVRAQNGHFLTFLQFLEFVDISLEDIDHITVIAFIELLVHNGIKHNSVLNYLSSIKAKFRLFNFSLAPLEHEWVALCLRSISLNVPVAKKLKGVLSLEQLEQIVDVCDTVQNGVIYKAVFLLAFFAFLRLSNLVPCSAIKFDAQKHLARGDVIVSDASATLILKWSKTIQKPGEYKCFGLPNLGKSKLCPVSAYVNMCNLFPLHADAPMFCVPQGTGYVSLSEAKVRKVLASVLASLGIDNTGLTFHTFRRSGASFAFQNNVPVHEIKKHGTWAGDSVWRYIVQDACTSDKVTTTIEQMLRQ